MFVKRERFTHFIFHFAYHSECATNVTLDPNEECFHALDISLRISQWKRDQRDVGSKPRVFSHTWYFISHITVNARPTWRWIQTKSVFTHLIFYFAHHSESATNVTLDPNEECRHLLLISLRLSQWMHEATYKNVRKDTLLPPSSAWLFFEDDVFNIVDFFRNAIVQRR